MAVISYCEAGWLNIANSRAKPMVVIIDILLKGLGILIIELHINVVNVSKMVIHLTTKLFHNATFSYYLTNFLCSPVYNYCPWDSFSAGTTQAGTMSTIFAKN